MTQQRCDWNEATQAFDFDLRIQRRGQPEHLRPALRAHRLRRPGAALPGEAEHPAHASSTPSGAEREVVQGLALGLDLFHRNFRHPYETAGDQPGLGQRRVAWPSPAATATAAARPSSTSAPRRGQPAATGAPPLAAHQARGPVEDQGLLHAQPSWRATCSTASTTPGATSRPATCSCTATWPTTTATRSRRAPPTRSTRWVSAGLRYRYYSGRPYNRLYRNDVTGAFDLYRARVGENPGTNINDPDDDRSLRLPDLQDRERPAAGEPGAASSASSSTSTSTCSTCWGCGPRPRWPRRTAATSGSCGPGSSRCGCGWALNYRY